MASDTAAVTRTRTRLRLLLTGFEWFVRQLSVVAGLALVLMMLHVVADVLMKFVFNLPITGTPEIVAYYYMVAAVFLALAYVELTGKHITVDLLYNHMPRRMKRAAQAISYIGSTLFFSLLAYTTWFDAVDAYRIGQIAMGSAAIPIWPSRFVLPLGFAAVALTSVVRLIGEVILELPSYTEDAEAVENETVDVTSDTGDSRG